MSEGGGKGWIVWSLYQCQHVLILIAITDIYIYIYVDVNIINNIIITTTTIDYVMLRLSGKNGWKADPTINLNIKHNITVNYKTTNIYRTYRHIQQEN